MTTSDRFDVAAYVRRPLGPMRANLAGVGAALPVDLAEALRYVQRRAAGTTAWLSHVLVTPTHKDARITAFLSTWAYERHWLGDAVGALAGEGGGEPLPRRLLQGVADRFGPLIEAIVANVHGRALTGVQMTERLVDGWIVEAMLERAQALAPASVAQDLGRIREVLAREGRFFAESATEALTHSRAARALARRRLRRRAWPIGADREPRAATAAALRTLFGADRDWAASIDARVDALPGLAGLGLVVRAVRHPGRRSFRIPLRAASSRRALPTDAKDDRR